MNVLMAELQFRCSVDEGLVTIRAGDVLRERTLMIVTGLG